MKLPSTRTTAALIALLAVAGAIGGATAVPDARMTIDSLDVSSTEPAVGERVTVNVSVASSGGSLAGADVQTIRLFNDTDDEPLDEATDVGALSAGDSLTADLWTRFDDPGETRLTVEVIAAEPPDDGDGSGETVRVTRDVVIDVQPAAVELDLRTRALSPGDLQDDDGDEGAGVNLGGIEGVFGGGAGGLEADDDIDGAAQGADSPVAVTVVNTGTSPADRVSLRATAVPVDADGDADSEGTQPQEIGPFAIDAVAPGEERRVIVDLGPLDQQSAVTFTASFRSGTDAQDGVGAARTTNASLAYPPSDADPVVTDGTVTVTETDGDHARLVVDANLGNAGSGDMEGVVVSVADGDGVAPTPAGETYFVGTLGGSDFVGFDIRTTANTSVAETIPLRIEYTDRGVTYTETIPIDLDTTADSGAGSGTFGTLGALGGVGVLVAIGLAGAAGLAVVGGVVRRRDV